MEVLILLIKGILTISKIAIKKVKLDKVYGLLQKKILLKKIHFILSQRIKLAKKIQKYQKIQVVI